MQFRTCTKCRAQKPLEQFSLNSRNKQDGRQPKCKDCVKQYRIDNATQIKNKSKEYCKNNSDKAILRASEWAKNNRKRSNAIKAKWRLNNSEKMEAIRKEWDKNNPDYRASQCRKYQASKLNSVPLWANNKKMREIYKESRRLTLETGTQYHVDHIVPLISNLVCGLHCEANLQILRFDENVKKGNRLWVDMP